LDHRALLPTLPPAQLASGDASQESGLVRETITIESMLAFAPEIFFELFVNYILFTWQAAEPGWGPRLSHVLRQASHQGAMAACSWSAAARYACPGACTSSTVVISGARLLLQKIKNGGWACRHVGARGQSGASLPRSSQRTTISCAGKGVSGRWWHTHL